jgi:ring-1,2-phenylacetyl-CoA epoxidase subunit PaaE
MALHFHTLQVASVTRETSDCIVVEFEIPADLRSQFAYRAGQYITLRADVGDRELRRSYSLCSAPHERRWQVAIKRVDGGQFSQWAHALLRPGDVIDVLPPDGHFVYTPAADAPARNVLLLAAGSGITPTFSILKTLLETETDSRVTLVYGNRRVKDIVFKEAIEDLRDRFLTRFQLLHTLSGEVQEAPIANGRLDGNKVSELFADLLDQVNGSGGSLEQTYSYLDHQSATNWHVLSNQSRYSALFRANMPLDAAAKHVLQSTRRAAVDVIGLGAGDGRQEVRLVQCLLAHAAPGERKPAIDVRLYLLDISQPLLGDAYKHAADALGDQRGVFVCAVQGNFHHLPRYTQLHYTPERSHRRRVVCMLGLTVGNLDNEVSFFRHSLSCFVSGDLFVLDVQRAYAPADNPEEIRRRDPGILHGLTAAHAEWLSGPFLRYSRDVTDVAFRIELNTSCPVPGSYALEAIATVRLTGRRQKEFSAFRFKRYDIGRLADCLSTLGWERVADLPYGAAGETPVHTLLLFRKR